MRHSSMRLALLATALASLLVPASAAAKASTEEINTAKNKGVEYLKGLQKEGGEIPGFGGDWALTALAAAGTAPADVNKAGKEGSDARSWYEGVVGAATWPGEGAVATDPERGVLLAYAAGIDPARVSKRQNLIAKVASFYQPASPDYYGETLNGTVFGLLALAGAKTTAGAQRIPQIVLDQAVEAVKANQHTDGGWTWAKAAGSEEELKKASEPDMTGAAMAALCSAGVSSASTAITNAKAYLVSIFEGTTGAFKNTFGNNTDSNAWAVQGLKACGIDPQGAEFTGGGSGKKTPIDFLIAQQQKSGGFRYGTSGTTVDEYASQDAIRALGSGGFTATPPKPKSGPQFKGVTEFATGEAETTSLALIVDDGSSPLKICSVTLAPKATTTTLATVLNAAVAGTTPASCVTSFLPASGEGAITQINGAPAVPAEKWNVSIDSGTEAVAKRSTVIHVGDTIYLRQQ
ncbi:MAG TPA: prenyltransferase/squalene oxidase repeat-containing protein [Solirubrobacterales bacterium]|nr:prenyltransferase/squalene oxidase repeat-containing protein [Solirubrobacterales bacterium]